MMVWLTPALMDGTASGRSTFVSRYHLLAPKEMAASRTFSGSPKSENRQANDRRAAKDHRRHPGSRLAGAEKGDDGDHEHEGRHRLYEVHDGLDEPN